MCNMYTCVDRGVDHYSVIHQAAKHGKLILLLCVHIATNHNCNTNHTIISKQDNFELIHVAIKCGHLNIVHYLLEEQQLSPLTPLKASLCPLLYVLATCVNGKLSLYTYPWS